MTHTPLGAEMFSILTTHYASRAASTAELRLHINRPDLTGHSPLHYSIVWTQFNGTSLLSSFLDCGPDLHLKIDANGQNLFHLISMFGTAATIACLFRDLSKVDLLSAAIHGYTPMDLLLARLREEEFWDPVPPHCPEDALALIKFVVYARTFEPRLPRIVYGPRFCIEGEELDFRLFDAYKDTSAVAYKWPTWVDVEDWVAEHGHLEIPDEPVSEVAISEDGSVRDGDEEDEDVSDYNDEDNEAFFDATDLPFTSGLPAAQDNVHTVNGLNANPT